MASKLADKPKIAVRSDVSPKAHAKICSHQRRLAAKLNKDVTLPQALADFIEVAEAPKA